MTVSTEISHEEYTGNGVTTTFPYRFRITNSAYMLVKTADLDGNEATLVLNTDYTLTGVKSYSGGNVILTNALPIGWRILLERNMPLLQGTDLRNQGSYFAEVHEDAFDYMTMLIQKVAGWFNLALRRPSWISNHYDAQGYKISNVNAPTAANDAANKGYVDDGIAGANSNAEALFGRTLRVPGSYIAPLPPLADAEGKTIVVQGGAPRWITPESGTATDVLVQLAAPTGARLSGLKQGGTVQDGLVSFYADGFGADPTGADDSTAAVLLALDKINGMDTSDYDNSISTYAEVVFGNGTYVVGDIPFLSGVRFRGQGQFATRIMPKVGAEYCFTTTEMVNNRLFQSGIMDMTIGSGYQGTSGSNYDTPPENAGGIHVKEASYFTLHNVVCRYLDGVGVKLGNVWDSDFTNLRIMNCGNARDTANIVPGLDIGPGDSATDGSNALRYRGLHIEECSKLLSIGPRTRHVSFTSPKFEGTATAYPCTIDGATSVTFDCPECTWQRSDNFMFYMVRTSEETDNQLILFESPTLISSLNSIGNYFHYDSHKSPLVISNAMCRGVRQLASGRNIVISGGTSWLSGAVMVSGSDSILIDDVYWKGIIQPESAVSPSVSLNGPGCRVTNCKFHFNGSVADGFVGVYLGALCTDAVVTDNQFEGARNTALSIDSAAFATATVYGNKIVNGGQFTSLISGMLARNSLLHTGSPAQPAPIAFTTTVLNNGAATTFSTLTHASLILVSATYTTGGVTYSDSALVLLNNSSATVAILSSLRAVIADGSGGTGTAGKIYITKSGSGYTVTNQVGASATIKIMNTNL